MAFQPDTFVQILLSIPGDVAVTREDVAAEAACAQLASGRSELVGLALWLIAQRCKVNPCSVSHSEVHPPHRESPVHSTDHMQALIKLP